MFVKLSQIAESKATFRIVEVKKVQYKMWSDAEQKMYTSPEPKNGYKKTYTCDIDAGHGLAGLDLSERQMADILELCFSGGMSNPVGVSLQVKMVKSGDRTSYYFNKANTPEVVAKEFGYPEMPKEAEVNVDDIPF